MTNRRYGFFHNTFEEYLYRQWRAYTIPRVLLFWYGSLVFMQHGFVAFLKTFPNVLAMKSFSAHPNYKLLGAGTSWFYIARPIFWTWVFMRMTKWTWSMVKGWYTGD